MKVKHDTEQTVSQSNRKWLKTLSLLAMLLVLGVNGVKGQTTFTWNFGTTAGVAASSSGSLANLTVGNISIGNTNGTVTMLSTTSASSGYTGSSGLFNAGNAARTGALVIGASGSAYFEFTLTPATGYAISLSSISFGTRSTSTAPQAYTLRSSADSYASDIVTGEINANSSWQLKSNTGITFSGASGTAVTFRLYGYNGTGSAVTSTINWRIDDLSINVSLLGGTPTVATPVFAPSTGTYYSTQNVTLSTTTDGATIRYTTNGDDPTESSTLYSSPISVSSTTTIKAKAFKTDMNASTVASATYTFPTINNVGTIALLRAGATDGTIYKLTGEALLTLKTATRNAKYIQDATGGILIDDNTAKITTTYNVGDGITGIIGSLTTFNGMLQFVPVTDPGTATSTGNVITPVETSLTNLSNYPGRLVKVTGISITGTGNFAASTNYTLSDGTNSGVLRTAYTDLPYIGSAIPSTPQDIVGVVLINTTAQLVPRTISDFSNTPITAPTIYVTEISVPAMTATTATTDTKTITVSGINLTGNITLAVTGTNAGLFSLSTNSIIPVEGNVTDEVVTITYTPTAAGSHSATLTLSSVDAVPVTRDLSGTATWELLSTPVATVASDVSATGLTANWNAVSGATEYEVSVYKIQDLGTIEKLRQEFTWADNSTGGNDGLWSGSIASATAGLSDHLSGWTVTAGYKGNYSIKMGAASTQGVLTTPVLGLNGNATLTFRAGAWDGTSEQTELLLEIDGGGSLNMSSVIMVKAAFTSYTVAITGGTAMTKITFKGKQASNSRFFLDDVLVTEGGVTNTPVSGSPFTVADATSKVLTGLAPGTEYFYTVKAQNTNVESSVSNEISTITDFTFTSNVNASSLATGPTRPLVIANDGHLTIDENRTFASVTVETGGKLTLNNGFTLAPGTFTIEDGGTFVDKRSDATKTSINATVNVELTGSATPVARQWWYVSSPVAAATAAVFNPEGDNNIGYFDETLSTPNYVQILSNSDPLEVGKGYLFQNKATATYSFSGSLNTGDVTLNLTRTGTSAGQRGFHIVGNPYPSYLNWKNAFDAGTSSNVRNTIWYRTTTGSANGMKFLTFNAATQVGTENVTGVVPPMQGFWMKVHADNSNGVIKFTNDMRKHADESSTSRKAPAVDNKQLLRLQVTNGVVTDEMVLVGIAGAADSFEKYDSEKMANNSPEIPELFTLIGSQEIAINSVDALAAGKQFILGFRPGKTGNFSISATQLDNIDAKVVLVDNISSTQTELQTGTSYSFSSDATATNNRFSIEFRAPGATTSINEVNASNTLVYVNEANQIAVQSAALTTADRISVFNLAGQQLVAQQAEGKVTVINNVFSAGLYLVKVNNHLQKVIVK